MSKKLIPIKIKLRVWDGTLDHSWYTNSVDGIAHISTPEQFADFITPTSSRSGITEVHLDNDLYFNEKYFENKTWNVDTQNKSIISTVGDTSRQKFVIDRNLTFYGNFHSIYGFSFKSTSNLENHFIYMEGINYNLTFKDLYWRNCYFTEAGGAGIFMGVDRESTKFIIMENVGFIDTYFDYRTIRSSSSSDAWKNSITTMSTKMNVVFKGCKLNNVQCISQKGLDLTSMPTSYELNVSMVDCDSTPTFFSVFNNPTTTGKHVYNNYNNTNIQNNKSSYNECVESFNSYESTSLSLIDLDDNFNYEGTPSPTDEYIEESVVIKSPKYWDGSFDDNSWESTLVQDGANYQYFISTPSQFMNFLYNIPVKSTSSTFHIYCYITDDLYFNKDYLNNKSWGYLESGINNQIKSWSDSGVPRFTSTYGQLYIDGISYSSTNRPCKLVGLYSCLPNKGVDRHYNAFMVVGNSWNSGGTSAYGIAYKGLEFDNCTFGIGNQGTIGEWTLASNDVYRRFYGLTFNSCKFEIFNGSSSYWNGLGLLNFESKSNIPAHYLFKNVIMKDCDYKSNASMKMVGFFAQQLTQSTGTLNMDEFEDFSNNYIENCKYIGSFTKFNKFGCFSANYSTPSSMSNNYYDSGCTIDNYTFGNQMLGNLDSHNNDAEKTIDFLNVNALVEKFDYKGKEYYSFELDGENKSLLPNDSDSPIHYQSKTEVEDPTPKYWDGTYDTSWKTKDSDGICHITTPEQFADFLRNNNESSKSGISNVVLDNDIYMNEDFENALNWSTSSSERKFSKTSRNAFTTQSLTFNGNGYTIYGLSVNLGTASWNTLFWFNTTGISFEFSNVRFYGFYIQTNSSQSTFNVIGYSDATNTSITSKQISFNKLLVNHLSNPESGRTKCFVCTLGGTRPMNIDFSFYNCDFSKCSYIIGRDWISGSDAIIPSSQDLSMKVSIRDSMLPNVRVLEGGLYNINVNANAYNNKTQEGTPESGHTKTNTIMNDTLESYISTHNDFSDYDFDTNGDYKDLQPLEPYNPSKYEKVEITKIPEGSDFLWVARDYDSSTKTTKNRVSGSSFGLLNTYNTPTIQSDSDGKKYLNFTNVNQYLYHALDSNAQTNLLGNGDNHCYTIIFKFLITNVTPSVIIMNLTKTKTSYCNMLWKTPKYRTLEIYSGNDNTTKSNIAIVNHFFLKYERTNSNVTLTCLDTNLSQTLSLSGTQYIDNEIRFMSAGHTWSYCDRFYGVYGIPRKLTDEETQDVVAILNDEAYKWYKIGDPKLLLINPKTLEGV